MKLSVRISVSIDVIQVFIKIQKIQCHILQFLSYYDLDVYTTHQIRVVVSLGEQNTLKPK